MPELSVIIPVYNAEPYIERCVRSLFEQTLEDIEYIFINDCTPDRSMEVLSRTLEDYPSRKAQVVVIDMPVNSGQAVATRVAVSVAKGEYLIRCDSDDSVDRDMYRKMYVKCKAGGYDLVVCDKYYLKDGRKTLRKVFRREYPDDEYRGRYLRNILDWHGNPTLVTAMVKRSVFDNDIRYPERIMGEDTTLLVQLAYYSSKVGYLSEALYLYWYNPSSTCNTMSEADCYKRYQDYAENFELIRKFLSDKAVEGMYSKELETLKHKIRMRLGPILHSRENIRKWMAIYPEIRWSVLLNGHVSLEEKKTIISKMIRYYLGL